MILLLKKHKVTAVAVGIGLLVAPIPTIIVVLALWAYLGGFAWEW